jgi:hypothetical protein
MFGVFFVLVLGLVVLTSVVYLTSSIILEQEEDNIYFSERAILAIYRSGFRFFPLVVIASAVAPVASVIYWMTVWPKARLPRQRPHDVRNMAASRRFIAVSRIRSGHCGHLVEQHSDLDGRNNPPTR